MVDWSQVCKRKEERGLGITNTENVNKALLTKWWRNILTHLDKIINKIFKDTNRPRKGPWVGTYRKTTLSSIWKGINSTKEILQETLAYELCDRRNISF